MTLKRTLPALLALLNPAAASALQREIEAPSTTGVAIYGRTGDRYLIDVMDAPFDPTPFNDTGDPLIGYWKKAPRDVRVPSLTAQAVSWLEENPSASLREAARRFRIDPAAISRAIKRKELRELCPHCGHVL